MFTWDKTKCDNEIWEHGNAVLMCAIPNKDCDEFIVEVSNLIGYKLDYNNMAGRNVVRCYANDYPFVKKAVSKLDKALFTKYGMDENGYLFY
jgi:hypothetical protein